MEIDTSFRHVLRELIDYTPPKVTKRRPTLVGVGYNQYENWILKIARATEVDLNSHLLRHTAITVLAERNVDVRTIMELANWDDPSLLRRYAAASDPNMRAAVELLQLPRRPVNSGSFIQFCVVVGCTDVLCIRG